MEYYYGNILWPRRMEFDNPVARSEYTHEGRFDPFHRIRNGAVYDLGATLYLVTKRKPVVILHRKSALVRDFIVKTESLRNLSVYSCFQFIHTEFPSQGQ